jgi:hypothetical protein
MGETNEATRPPVGLRNLVMPTPASRVSGPAPVSVQVQPFSTGTGTGGNVAPFAQTMLPEEASLPLPDANEGESGTIETPKDERLWSGRLRPGDEVGRGAMGLVLRGMDTKLRRELALKVTPLPRNKLPMGQLARFVEEAQITAQLEHPNIVPVHDLGIDPDGRAYFSMKLVRGQSLDQILARRKEGDAATRREFGLRRLLDVFLQVCLAVEYAHARGVIHRDLKPANIMVGDFGEVLVMDWGVAKVKGRPDRAAESGGESVSSVRADIQALATQHGAVIGTPAYMSPEQAKGGDVDERSDVYALGVILYEILCGEVPFDGDEPLRTLTRLLTEPPRAPSTIQASVPSALEALVLRLLEKDPAKRTLGIRQTRSLIQDYIEGIGHDYRRESLWSNAAWLAGALGLFAFLVWYLTGQSVATVIALTPSAVFNSVGWLLVVMAIGSPLWAAATNLRIGRGERDRFLPPSSVERFVSGHLAHRTLSTTIAPVFQLVFIVEIFANAIAHATRGFGSEEIVPRIVSQLRAEWAQALIVILVFLFAYLFLLSTEVRFARRIDRYLALVKRPKWESIWPFFLILFVVATVVATDILDWLALGKSYDPRALVRDLVLTQPLNVFEIVKTLVFQGTFLLGLVVTAVVLAFPFAELLASLRVAYQPADDASVTSRKEYFLRSLAAFQIVKANWLYGGAMIGSLTAVSILSEHNKKPLVEQVLYILGPALIGFAGYFIVGRYAKKHLAEAPAVRMMLREHALRVREEQKNATLDELRSVSWRTQLVQVAVPIACIIGYLVWNGSGVHQEALKQLIVPMSTKGWLLILPYVLLVPLLLVRDRLQIRRLSGPPR